MDALGLPARIGYAVVTLPIVGAAGFYSSMWLLPKLAVRLQGIDADIDGYGVFRVALCIGAGLAWTAALVALTLPWKRYRRRSGRNGRLAGAAVFVVLVSVAFAGQVHALMYDLAFAVWLAYAMAYTFVRYGVLDGKRSAVTGKGSSSADFVG